MYELFSSDFISFQVLPCMGSVKIYFDLNFTLIIFDNIYFFSSGSDLNILLIHSYNYNLF